MNNWRCRGDVLAGKKVVLTSDRTMMSTYHGGVILGFAAIMPRKILPRWLMYRLFCPPVDVDSAGNARIAPCGMRRMESALIDAGFDPDDIAVVHPDYLDNFVGDETRVVSISHDDPMGRVAYYEIESLIDRGPPYNRSEFIDLVNHPVIRKYGPKVVVGGSGAWEVANPDTMREVGISHVVMGEGEITGARLFHDIVAGIDREPILRGEAVDSGNIPASRGGTICGIVEIGRGCGRGCDFCLPTTIKPRSRPLDLILQDVRTNVAAGQVDILLHSEDALRYMGRGLILNRDAVLGMFRAVKETPGISTIDITHTALSTAVHNPDMVEAISEIVGIGTDQQYLSAWVGVESGSPRIIERHMKGKPAPSSPEEWPEVVRESFGLFHDNHWVPISSLVMGLPGETPDDVNLTLEMIDDLRDIPSMLFPLFFTSMGQTKLESTPSFRAEDCTPEHWMLLGECLEHNLKYSSELFDLYSERMSAGFITKVCIKTCLRLTGFKVRHYMTRMKQGNPPKDDFYN